MRPTVPTINVVGHEVPLPAYFKIVSSYNDRGMSRDAIVEAVMKHAHPTTFKATRDIVYHVTDNLQRMKADGKETVVQVPLDQPFAQYSPQASPQQPPTPPAPFRRSIINRARPRPASLAAPPSPAANVIAQKQHRVASFRSPSRPLTEVNPQSPLQHLEALTDAMTALTCAEELEVELSRHSELVNRMYESCSCNSTRCEEHRSHRTAVDIEAHVIMEKQNAARIEVAKAKARVERLQKRPVMPRGGR